MNVEYNPPRIKIELCPEYYRCYEGYLGQCFYFHTHCKEYIRIQRLQEKKEPSELEKKVT